jgi:hypothetical protein
MMEQDAAKPEIETQWHKLMRRKWDQNREITKKNSVSITWHWISFITKNRNHCGSQIFFPWLPIFVSWNVLSVSASIVYIF